MMADDSGSPFGDEPVPISIEDSLDLHGFQPREVRSVVDAYLDAAREAGFREVRLIHGRGRGVQRRSIQAALAKDPRVARYEDAPPSRGGFGATLVWLLPV